VQGSGVGRADDLGLGFVPPVPEKKKMWRVSEGWSVAAVDQRRQRFEEGGAARRRRSNAERGWRLWPVVVAGELTGGREDGARAAE
jgi:hypothetical protein